VAALALQCFTASRVSSKQRQQQDDLDAWVPAASTACSVLHAAAGDALEVMVLSFASTLLRKTHANLQLAGNSMTNML
jgi:hypothetical protein